jgi:dTDP-4-amino-4,6-dideoxygalactose transaminase
MERSGIMSKDRIEFGEIRIGETARRHIDDCLQSNWISAGPKVRQLEKEFAALMGADYGVAVSSGTAALTCVTLTLPEMCKRKVVRGKSKVICPALGFIATSAAVVHGGLIPVWADIDPDTLNMNTGKVEELVLNDPDIVAIYAVGTMGLPANLPRLREIADQYDLFLFEDACENYGATINGEQSWTWAHGGCSSMFTAHLCQSGEGSVIYTDDDKFRDLLKSVRSHGRHPDSAYFDHVRLGGNFKMTDLCASIGLEGVEQFTENIAERKKVWWKLVNHVYDRGYDNWAWFSHQPEGVVVMPHGFSITMMPGTKDIQLLKDVFDRENIHWKLNFGEVSQHGAMNGLYDRECPNAYWCGTNGIHVGTHRFMSDDDVERITDCLDEVFAT